MKENLSQAAEHNRLAIGALEAGPDKELAEFHYLKALDHEPDSPMLHYNTGVLYDEFFRNWEKAKFHYEEAIRCDKGFADAYIALCELAMDLDNVPLAKSCAEKILVLEPKNSRNLNNLGCILVKFDKAYDQALHYFEKALAIAPDNSVTHANMADALMNLGQHEEAAAAYEEALRLEPDNPLYCFYYAQILRLHFQAYDEAETYFKKAIRLDPTQLAPYRALRSMYCFDLQDDQRGAQILEAAAKYFPGDPALLLEIAGIYDYQLGDFPKARDYYEKVVALKPDHRGAWSALGVICSEMLKDYERGVDAYTKVLELAPDDLHANLNMGHLYFYRYGKVDLAKEYYEHALSLMKDSEEEQVYGGEVYLSLGILYEQHEQDYHQAIEHYEKAIEIGNEELAKRRLLALYEEDFRVH